jgi:uncharacterized repeat protein (TIGR01451 family)
MGMNGRTVLRVLTATAVIAGLLIVAAPARAAFPGGNGKIAFQSLRDGNWEVYSMDPDGSGQTNLTNDPAFDANPAWSPDGTKIAFGTNRDGNFEVYVMNADGSGATNLTNSPSAEGGPAWSPDGTRIAYARDGEIYVMNADGSGQTNLTNHPSIDSLPAWSPDGAKIAFNTNRDGIHGEVYVMNADGTEQTNLTNNPTADNTADWSPDGTSIAFQTDRDGNFEVYTVAPDGTGATNVTNDPGPDFQPAWSPDGTMIAFTTDRLPREIFVMNADGTGQTNLTNHPGTDQAPDWQPVPLVDLSVDDVSVAEGDTGTIDAVFTVALSSPSIGTVTVDYQSADLSATAPDDYQSASGTLTFSPGDTTEQVTIPVNGDAIDESDEQFVLELFNPTNATIARGRGIGTILDDDAEPDLSVDDVAVLEGDTGTVGAFFTVSLTPASGRQVTVDYETADGTAVSPDDYGSVSGGLVFLPGETSKEVVVPVVGDTIDEVEETFTLYLNNAVNAGFADSQGLGTITDDEVFPDLSLTNADSPNVVAAGENITYTLTVRNLGFDTATQIGLVDPLPASTTFVSASTSQGTCGGTSTVVCNLGSLPPDGAATVTIVARASRAGTVTNTATVDGNEADPNLANNSASAQTTVTPSADGCTIVGSGGNDQLTGTAGQDVICGLGGSDTLAGLGSADTIRGGDGNDVLQGGKGGDLLYGDLGRDNITGGKGPDSLDGGDGDDTLKAADGVSENDSADGGPGTDSCTADPGDIVTNCP